MKDGSQVAGRFGSNSLASSDILKRDLYIEEVYKIGKSEDEEWNLVSRTDGIWICSDEIKLIEFWTDKEEKA